MSEQTQYIQSVQLTKSGYLVNGNMSVPNDPGNRHYKLVQDWIAEGNTPEPMPEPTTEDIKEQIKSQRQAAYRDRSDPIFMKRQRGEATEQEWIDEVAAIRLEFPYPEEL